MKHIPLSLFSTQLISQLIQYLINKTTYSAHTLFKKIKFILHFQCQIKFQKRCFRFIVFATDRFNNMRIYILKSSAMMAFISLF